MGLSSLWKILMSFQHKAQEKYTELNKFQAGQVTGRCHDEELLLVGLHWARTNAEPDIVYKIHTNYPVSYSTL